MGLELLKILIESACADGKLTHRKRQFLKTKARELGIGEKDLNFLIENELNRQIEAQKRQDDEKNTTSESGFIAKDGQSGFVAASHWGETEQRGYFTDISQVETQGAMSLIFKAKYYGKWVAIKTIKEKFRKDKRYRELFFREFQTTFNLDHPNIVRVYGKGDNNNDPFYYMEYIEGKQLAQLIGPYGITDGGLIKQLVMQLLDALIYMHEAEVFHRDLKPENILVETPAKRIKLIDFGLAMGQHFKDKMQKAGTPKYAAPEQIENASQVDARADIYSFGLIFMEMLTGQIHDLQQVSQRAPALFDIIKKCTHQQISERYKNCEQIRYDLKNITILDLKFELKVSHRKVNFGRIEVGDTKLAEVKIVNRGIGPLNWQIKTAPEWLQIESEDNILEIRIKTTTPGKYAGQIELESNGGNAQIEVQADLFVKPVLQVEKKHINFGKVQLGQEKKTHLKITNAGTGQLEWEIVDQPAWLTTERQPAGLDLLFSPEKIGAFTGNIMLRSNGGTESIVVKAQVPNRFKPVIDVAPTEIHYDLLRVNERRTETVIIKNVGKGSLQWELYHKPNWVNLMVQDDRLLVEVQPKKEGLFAENIFIKSNGGPATITVSAEVEDPDKAFRQRKMKRWLTIVGTAVAALVLIAFIIGNIDKLNYFQKSTTETVENEPQTESAEHPPENTSIAGNTETDLWQEATQENTVEAYLTYLGQFPQGQYAADARHALESEPLMWQQAVQNDTKLDYFKYLEYHAKGEHAPAARQLFSLTDTSLCFTFDDPQDEKIQEDIHLSISDQTVYGRLLGSSYATNDGWIADLSGERSQTTLKLEQEFFSGETQPVVFRIEGDSLLRLLENGGRQRVYRPVACPE